MEEKQMIVVCAQLELFDTKNVIYQNKDVKEKAGSKICEI